MSFSVFVFRLSFFGFRFSIFVLCPLSSCSRLNTTSYALRVRFDDNGWSRAASDIIMHGARIGGLGKIKWARTRMRKEETTKQSPCPPEVPAN